jgi:type I restriction enzyme M protein
MLTTNRLEQHLWDAANILRGPVDAADFKTYIFPLLFFKRICDVWSEEFDEALRDSHDANEATFAENHQFQIPKEAHWNHVFQRTENLGQALQKALRAIEKANPNALHGIFGDANWANTQRLPDPLMRRLLDHFNALNLRSSVVREDHMGNAYEFLIKKFADGANKKAGEFYTPRSVVRLMVNILDPQPRESIYDPACGTGGMLLEAVQHIRERGGEWRNLKIRGQEKNLTTASIARMNLYLHGVEDFQVHRGDTLREPAFTNNDGLESFKNVIANPPFSLSGWGANEWVGDAYKRHLYGLPPESNGDFAWVMHMLLSMDLIDGRMAVVLPFGTLFRGGKELEIRRQILENDYLEAVIGLGPNLFYGTNIPAAVLVFQASKTINQKRRVFMLDAGEIVTKGRAQNTLSIEQADHIYAVYQAKKDVPYLARMVTLEEIAKNEYNINLTRYIERERPEESMGVEEALEQFKSALEAQRLAEDRLEAVLRKAGFRA